MRVTYLLLVSSLALALNACSQDPAPQAIQAIPENPADISIAGIESVEIVPGLTRRILLQGDGSVAAVGNTAVVHYTGWLFDPDAENFRGEQFDSSFDRGIEFEFPLGGGRVIRGWDEGVVGMEIGEVRELTIAPEFGYGERGAGPRIPPNSTLVFVVQLVDLRGLGAEQ